MHFFLVKCATLPQNFTLRGAASACPEHLTGHDLHARSHKSYILERKTNVTKFQALALLFVTMDAAM
jgi:hypothetical protein